MMTLIEWRNKTTHIGRSIDRIETRDKDSGAENLSESRRVMMQSFTWWWFVLVVQSKIISSCIDAIP